MLMLNCFRLIFDLDFILGFLAKLFKLYQFSFKKVLNHNEFFFPFSLGVRPYKCNLCEKSFTQRCSLESHCLKVHGVAHQYDYKQRRSKVSQVNLY